MIWKQVEECGGALALKARQVKDPRNSPEFANFKTDNLEDATFWREPSREHFPVSRC